MLALRPARMSAVGPAGVSARAPTVLRRSRLQRRTGALGLRRKRLSMLVEARTALEALTSTPAPTAAAATTTAIAPLA